MSNRFHLLVFDVESVLDCFITYDNLKPIFHKAFLVAMGAGNAICFALRTFQISFSLIKYIIFS